MDSAPRVRYMTGCPFIHTACVHAVGPLPTTSAYAACAASFKLDGFAQTVLQGWHRLLLHHVRWRRERWSQAWPQGVSLEAYAGTTVEVVKGRCPRAAVLGVNARTGSTWLRSAANRKNSVRSLTSVLQILNMLSVSSVSITWCSAYL
jgi:hypothetical protein